MSIVELSDIIKISTNNLYSLRSTRRETFEYIFCRDTNMINSYYKFKDEVSELYHDLEMIYFTLKDSNRKKDFNLTDFGRFLSKNQLYKNANSFVNSFARLIFHSVENKRLFLNIEDIKRFNKIRELFEAYKQMGGGAYV